MSAAWRWLALAVALALAQTACPRGGARPASDGGTRAAPGTGTGAATPAAATAAELAREMDTALDFRTHTLRRFEARPGARVPVDGLWARYALFIGVPPAALVPAAPATPAAAAPNAPTSTFYQQVHLGYPVAGYGYTVESADGLVRSGIGKTMPGLPPSLPKPISRELALAIALRHIAIGRPYPWESDPNKWHPPQGHLALWSGKVDPAGPDFALVWMFTFAGTGVLDTSTLTIDADSGVVLVADPGALQ